MHNAGAIIKKQTTDQAIRGHLRHYLTDNTLRVVEEFDVENGISRADLVGISDVDLHGYEIKSDVDTLMRLPSQVHSYDKVFSRMTIVVGSNHLKQIIYMVPEWWGIMLAKYDTSGEIVLNNIRKAGTNPQLDTMSLLRLLMKDEISVMIKASSDTTQPERSTKETLARILCSQLDENQIRQAVATSLFQRYCS